MAAGHRSAGPADGCLPVTTAQRCEGSTRSPEVKGMPGRLREDPQLGFEWKRHHQTCSPPGRVPPQGRRPTASPARLLLGGTGQPCQGISSQFCSSFLSVRTDNSITTFFSSKFSHVLAKMAGDPEGMRY